MKRFLMFCILFFSVAGCAFSQTQTADNIVIFASQNGSFYGLKDKSDNIIVDAKYKKIVKLGNNAYIIQNKLNKFGLIDFNGNILVKPKYNHVERIFDKWVKLGNDRDYGLYNQYGDIIIPPKFTLIEPLFGHKFLTCRNYKYGVYSSTGQELLANKYDFIYTPTFDTMRVRYKNDWFEIKEISKKNTLDLPEDDIAEFDDKTYVISKIVINTGIGTGYGVVTAADYSLKILSTFSNAYEDTIDELMFSKGVDSIPIIMKFTWLPKFPVVFAKKYYFNIFEPDNSPLSSVRTELIEQMK